MPPPGGSSPRCWPRAGCAGPTWGWSACPPRCPRRGLRLVEVVPGSPAARSGLKAGDLVLSVGRTPVSDAQGIQRLLFADAIGIPLPVTVLRNGAMVDVMAVPVELTDG